MKKLVLALALALLTVAGCAHSQKQGTEEQSKAEVTQPAKAATSAAATDESKISCTKGSETRTLEIESKGKGCELEYTKGGKTSVVSSSTHSMAHCKASKKKIESKLEKAGYHCG